MSNKLSVRDVDATLRGAFAMFDRAYGPPQPAKNLATQWLEADEKHFVKVAAADVCVPEKRLYPLGKYCQTCFRITKRSPGEEPKDIDEITFRVRSTMSGLRGDPLDSYVVKGKSGTFVVRADPDRQGKKHKAVILDEASKSGEFNLYCLLGVYFQIDYYLCSPKPAGTTFSVTWGVVPK